MKIIHIVSALPGGGKERRMIQLIKGLKKAGGFEQYVVAFMPRNDYKGMFETDAKYILIQSQGKYAVWRELSSLIGEIRPDIVHDWCVLNVSMIFLPLLKLKYKFKYIAGFVADANKAPLFSTYTLCSQFAFASADAIVSNSIAGLKAKRAMRKKSHVFYNGFDFSRIEGKVEDPSLLKEDLGITSKYVVAMMARFDLGKDWTMFFNVANEISSIRDDVTFVAFGQGPTKEKYEQWCKTNNLKNVVFAGFQPKADRFFSIIDISVLFTDNRYHAEGVSNSIIEAMAARVPVVATNGGGTPEIIDSGNNSFIVSPQDFKNAAKTINLLLSNPDIYKCISESGRRTIEVKFSLEKSTIEYISMYQKLAK